MVVEVIDAPWAGVPARIRWHNTALDVPRNHLPDGDIPGPQREGVRTPGASGCAGDKNDSAQPSRQMRHTSSVEVAYHCAQQVREVFHQATPAQGQRLAARLIQRLPACSIPEIARLGANPTQVEGRTRRLLRYRRSKQRLHGSHQLTLSSWADAPPEATATPPATNSECSSSQEV